MKKSFLLMALVAGLSSVAQAQVASWNFTGDAGNQTSEAASYVVSNMTGAAITRSSGLAASGAGDSFSSLGWESTTSGFGSDEYMSFGFTVADGYSLDLNQLLVGTRSSNTGPGTLGLFYSGDSFTSQLHTFSQSGTTTLVSDINLSALTGLTGNVEFRIYEIGNTQADGIGDTASGGTFRLAGGDGAGNMLFTGTVAAVPEPETYAMLLAGLGLIGGGAMRRRQAMKA